MIRSKKITITLCIAICSITSAFAQKDYVVTLTGDTLRGRINADGLKDLKIRFADTLKKVKYKSSAILSYHVDKHNKDYESVQVPSKKDKLFLLRMETGKIVLYQLLESYSGGYPARSYTSINWYAAKEGEPLFEVKTNDLKGGRKERKDAFYKAIEDNPLVAQKYLAEDKFSFDQIRSIISEYNAAAKL